MSLLPGRKRARHAKPSKTAPVLAAAGLTGSFVAADVALIATSASAATADDFYRLRVCESGNNYRINTGNGFYGAYQFDQRTWSGLGYGGRPDQAAPATQDAAAANLQSQRGWSPWPACSRRLGLGSAPSQPAAQPVVAESAVQPQVVPAPRASRSRTRFPIRVAAAPTTPPPFAKILTVADAGRFRADVQTWQQRMRARGWHLAVDGYFGPQSSQVAKQFAAEKRLHLTVLPGEVDHGVWDAAWRLPVA